MDVASVEAFVSDFTDAMDRASELHRQVESQIAVIDHMLTTIEARQTDTESPATDEATGN
jgi:hypothetical protein